MDGVAESQPPEASKASYIAVLDASGTDDGQPVTCVAGLLARAAEWSRFKAQWQKTLNRLNVPLEQGFHMTQVFGGHHPFGRRNGWTAERLADLVGSLCQAIAGHAEFSVGRLVENGAYNRELSDSVKARCGTAAGFCFAQCVHTLRSALPTDLPANEQLAVVFDQDSSETEENLRRIYLEMQEEEIRSGVVLRLGSLMFRDRRSYLPLQAVDLVAHQAFQHLRDRLVQLDVLREAFRWVLEGTQHDFRHFASEDLRSIQSALQQRSV